MRSARSKRRDLAGEDWQTGRRGRLCGRRRAFLPRLEFRKLQRGELRQRRFDPPLEFFELQEDFVLPGLKLSEQANGCRRSRHPKPFFL